jgi:hypothetical protein
MLKAHKQVKTPMTDTSAPSDQINFDDAVREGKKIVARIEARNEETEHDHYLLGELADKVETSYDDCPAAPPCPCPCARFSVAPRHVLSCWDCRG